MSEVLSSDSYFNYSPSNHERASVYIGDGMSEQDREAATALAQSFISTERPVAETAVLIPVAAHQDGENIIPTLAEYARQRNAKPFTVFLHLNAPLDTADTSKVDEAEANVRIAKELFPNLDIRHNVSLYDHATIGEIRRNLWNGAFLLAYHEHGFSKDVVGINNDIDTSRVSPHYIARIQKYYEQRLNKARMIGSKDTLQMPSATRVTHAVLPTHPNTGMVTTWVDNTYFQAPGHVAYEAGLVVPFSYYANMLGFDEESKTHETSWITGGKQVPYISGAQLYTSPRRYIERLHNHDTSAIWTEDSFGSDDSCRERLEDDISFERAEELIFDRLQDDVMHYWLPGVLKPIYEDLEVTTLLGGNSDEYLVDMIDRAGDLVEKQLAKAERMLRKVVKSEILADLAATSIDARYYATTQVTSIHRLHEMLNDPTSQATISLK